MNMEARRPITQTSAYLNLKQRITKGKIEDQRKINFELLDRIVQLSDRIDILEKVIKNVSSFMDNQNKINNLISDLPNKTRDALLEFQNYINGEIVPRVSKLEKGDTDEGVEVGGDRYYQEIKVKSNYIVPDKITSNYVVPDVAYSFYYGEDGEENAED